MKKESNSSWNFPADLLVVSGMPTIVIALAYECLFSLRGWQWVAAYCCALLLAIAGAVYLFRAKLPLYRQRRFFTFGSHHLPPSSIPLYRIGYRLSIAGILLASVLLTASLHWRGF